MQSAILRTLIPISFAALLTTAAGCTSVNEDLEGQDAHTADYRGAGINFADMSDLAKEIVHGELVNPEDLARAKLHLQSCLESVNIHVTEIEIHGGPSDISYETDDFDQANRAEDCWEEVRVIEEVWLAQRWSTQLVETAEAELLDCLSRSNILQAASTSEAVDFVISYDGPELSAVAVCARPYAVATTEPLPGITEAMEASGIRTR